MSPAGVDAPLRCVQARGEDEFGRLDGDGEEGGARSGGGLPWEGSDRDYTFEELLGGCSG